MPCVEGWSVVVLVGGFVGLGLVVLQHIGYGIQRVHGGRSIPSNILLSFQYCAMYVLVSVSMSHTLWVTASFSS